MKRFTYILLSILLSVVAARGQSRADLKKIPASKAASSALVYVTAGKEIPKVSPGDFYDENECMVRGGLPNFFGKIARREDVTVALIGGSITQGEYCYRLQISKYLEDKFPQTRFRWINAGVAGTNTDLGAFRLDEHVLRYKPDLVFIEFAVNGGYPDGMEGMIRKIISGHPQADICLIYTIFTEQTADYQRGGLPPRVEKLESLADYYAISSIHLGMEASMLEKEGKLLWKGTQEQAAGRILFSNDGTHPIATGGNLYAAAIARAMAKLEKQNVCREALPLPTPLISDAWQAASMYLPLQIATFDDDWSRTKTATVPGLRIFNERFGELITAEKPGASFSFVFEGDMFGIFDVGGPEVGQMEFIVDGEPVGLTRINIGGSNLFEAGRGTGDSFLNRFNAHCNNTYLGQYAAIKLTPGVHSVTARISSEKADKKAILGPNKQQDISANPEKYDRTAVYLGRILLRGKPLAKPAGNKR